MTNEQYPISTALLAHSGSPRDFTPYDVLKSFRDYEKHRRTTRATDSVMHAHEDGSVYCHNTEDCSFSRLYSFDEIVENLSEDHRDGRLPLWKRIYLNWG